MSEELSTPLKAEIEEELEKTNLQAPMKVTLTKLEDFQNRTMRSTLIFNNISGI